MSYKLTNISGGQIVCDLASGKTLRLNNRQSCTVEDEDITKHIRVLESKKLMLCQKVSSKENNKKK